MHPPAMARRDATTPATEIKSLDMHIPSAQLPTIHHLGISGGKDSTALLLWAVYESGYTPESLSVTFCDTGNESELTYAHVRLLSERVHPILWLQPPLDFYALARKKKRFPSAKARFCTQELKMLPTQRHIQSLLSQGHDVIAHSGIRADESPARAQLPERQWDGYLGCKMYRPLLHWTLEEVWAIHARYGIPPNPLYALGAKRVGCFPCIMSRKAEIHHIARHFPGRIERIRAEERSFDTINGQSTFFARTKVPLCQRSKTVITRQGEMKVPTIDDVVRWSRTSRGGQQYELELDDDDRPNCDSQYGFCE